MRGKKLQSLREAQLWMLREYQRGTLQRVGPGDEKDRRAPPYYWAAFVLSGDWR
jgi:CHAT domain-containing protein